LCALSLPFPFRSFLARLPAQEEKEDEDAEEEENEVGEA
jgi:hypothetical protein